MTSSISTEEVKSEADVAAQLKKAEDQLKSAEEQLTSAEELKKLAKEEEEFNPDDAQGNVLDEEEGKNALRDLGYDTKEFLTKEEMVALYGHVFLEKEYTEEEEKHFYENLVVKAIKDLPEKVLNTEVRKHFDIQFLMKYIQEAEPTEEEEEIEHKGTRKSFKYRS